MDEIESQISEYANGREHERDAGYVDRAQVAPVAFVALRKVLRLHDVVNVPRSGEPWKTTAMCAHCGWLYPCETVLTISAAFDRAEENDQAVNLG